MQSGLLEKKKIERESHFVKNVPKVLITNKHIAIEKKTAKVKDHLGNEMTMEELMNKSKDTVNVKGGNKVK